MSAAPTRHGAGALIALVGVVFVGMTGFGVFLPVFPFLALHVGATPTQATMAMGAYSFGQLIASPLWGRLSDRVGRKPVLVAGLVATAVSYVLLARAETILELGGARLFAGLMAGNIGAAFAAAADLADPDTRARNMGLLGAAAGTAFIAGPALGALVITGAEHGAGYDRVCYVSAAIAGAATLMALALFRETLPKEKRRARGESRTRTWALVRARPALALLALVMFLMVTAQATMESTFGLWADVEFDWGAREVGYTLAALGFGAALMQGGASGFAARHVGEAGVLRIGLTFSAIGLLIAANTHGLNLLIPACIALTIGFGLVTPALQSLFAAQSRDADRGAVMGLAQSSAALGRVVGPASSGAIFDGFGHFAPFLAGGALSLAALGLAFALTQPETSLSS